MAAAPTTIKDTLARRKLSIIALLAVIAGGYIAIPQLGFFNANWQALTGLKLPQLFSSVVVLLVSFGMAALVYICLSIKKLAFSRTYLVQIAGAFAGKVLPAGLGSISVSYLYLRKQRISAVHAATTVAANNLLGFVSHGLWMAVLTVIWLGTGHKLAFDLPSQLLIVGSGVLVIVLAVTYVLLKKRFQKSLRQITNQLQTYRQQYWRIVLGLGASLALTGCTIGMVYLSAQAIAIPISFMGAAIALTTGLLAQTITPTPGGVGGVEAGLASGLVLTGLESSQAVLVTITFRLISFWLPLAFGGIALAVVLRRKLI